MTRNELREKAFKILFKLEFNPLEEMDEQFEFSIQEIGENDEPPCVSEEDAKYIKAKLDGVIEHLSEIDSEISANSNGWQISRIGKAELAILRLAIYEMKFDDDIPVKVAVNEAVELTKRFCKDDASRFVNGILSNVKYDE